jgi:RNA polymerase-binding transcription factor
MAKKATAKKAASKKSSRKSSKGKSAGVRKKSIKKTTAKKTTKSVKSSAKKTAVKAASKKKITKPKSTVKRTVSETSMARKKKKQEETAISIQKDRDEAQSAAEARAKALSRIKGYSKKDLDHFRELIMAKRDEIIEQLQNLKDQMLDPTTGEYINENSPYSLHMAEQGTDAMEREKIFLYAQRENKFLGYLEDALKRIDAGTYGICVECVEDPQHLCPTCPLIPKARLEAVPHSQLCLQIKQKQEKERR